jgi:hypothetical protein
VRYGIPAPVTILAARWVEMTAARSGTNRMIAKSLRIN